ncbi:MAG: helix-turn-helix domain-containing protein [Candidatus Rokuibacteriota bacterium]
MDCSWGRLIAWDAMAVVLDGEEFLTVDEAARLLGVKRATLYAYVSRGVLKSYRQGIKRQRLYRRSEIESLLRLAPSAAAPEPETRREQRRAPDDIPLAESWIRD